MNDMYFYVPSQGHGLAQDPIGAIVGPRPIGWISTRDLQGNRNLAPYSFFGLFNYAPPIVAFSSVGYKDSVRNAEATREFVCNLATRSFAEAMNATSRAVASDIDEFNLAGLTEAPSCLISVPRVSGAPVALECRVTKTLRLCGIDGQECDTWMVFGEVVGVHIDRRLLQDNVYLTERAQPILRGGGAGDYFEIRPDSKFQMKRPR